MKRPGEPPFISLASPASLRPAQRTHFRTLELSNFRTFVPFFLFFHNHKVDEPYNFLYSLTPKSHIL